MEENISCKMNYLKSESDSVHEWGSDSEYDSGSDLDYEYVTESTYGKEIWRMIDVQLYIDIDLVTHKTCHVKHDLLLNHFYGKNKERDDNFSVLQDYALSETHNVIKPLIYVNNRITPIITTYVQLLLTYNKYNKLHILKNKTKLNNDIIFNIIIKYMI